jgi:hypothetical protein
VANDPTGVGEAGEGVLALHPRVAGRHRLDGLAGGEHAEDVLTFAGSLEGIERELVAKDVVRTFATVRRLATIG